MKLTIGYIMVEPSFNQLKTFFLNIHENGNGFQALEHMISGNKNTLVLENETESTFLGRKIRFIGSAYCERLNAIREMMYQSQRDDVTLLAMKNLASLLREQFHEGNFIYEEKLADGTIQALASSNIADKLASGELKRVNKKGEQKEYSYLNTLSDAELEQLQTITDKVLSEEEIEAQRKKNEEKPTLDNTDLTSPTPQQHIDNKVVTSEHDETALFADTLVQQTTLNAARKAQDVIKDDEQQYREDQKQADEKATVKLADIKKEEIKKQELKKEIVETEVEKTNQTDETVT